MKECNQKLLLHQLRQGREIAAVSRLPQEWWWWKWELYAEVACPSGPRPQHPICTVEIPNSQLLAERQEGWPLVKAVNEYIVGKAISWQASLKHTCHGSLSNLGSDELGSWLQCNEEYLRNILHGKVCLMLRDACNTTWLCHFPVRWSWRHTVFVSGPPCKRGTSNVS